jgi:hypothetical protein
MLRLSKSGAHLEIQHRNKAPMTWRQIMGPKGLGASGPKGLEPNH